MVYHNMLKFKLRSRSLLAVLATLVVCQSAQAVTVYQDMIQGMDGLLAYYTFDDVTTSSTTLADDSGNGHTGFFDTTYGSVNVSADTAGPGSGLALNLPDTGGAFVSNIDETGFVEGNAARTAVLWMKSSDTEPNRYGYMLNFGYVDGVAYYETVAIVTFNGIIQTSTYGIGDNGETNVVDDAWHMIAVTVEPVTGTTDQARWSTYIDGSATADSTMVMTTKTAVDGIGTIGSRVPGHETRTFKGLLDEVSYFNRALTSEEMGTLYNTMLPPSTYEGNDSLLNGDFSDGLNGWLTTNDSSNGTPVDTIVTDGVATISRDNGCSDWSTGVIYQVVNVPEGTKVRVDAQWAGDQTDLAPSDMWWGEVAIFSMPDLTEEKLLDVLDYPGHLQEYIAEGETNRGGSYAAANEMLNSFGSAYPNWSMEDIDNNNYDWEAMKAAFEANGHTWDPSQRLEYNFTEVESCGQVVVALKYGGESPAGSLSFDNITLTVVPDNIPGDANNDGQVDGSDVTILAGNWQKGVNDGQTAYWADGDFNGDGKVDGSDVTILAGNWQYGVEASASAVPEPNTLVLLLAAVSSFLIWKRTK